MNNSLYIDWILVVHFGLHFVVLGDYAYSCTVCCVTIKLSQA